MTREPVGETLDAVVAFIRRYVVLPAEAADFLALWALHTWAFEAAETTPYVRVVSPERQCGKTRLLEALEKVTRRGWHTVDVTAAVLYRKGETEAPTLLFDEVDQLPFEDRRGVIGVLNAGYKISGRVWRCTDKGELLEFNAFYPKAIAGLDNGKVPDTIVDRSVHVRLKRRRPGEMVAKFRHGSADREAEPLRDAMHAWAIANLEPLAHAEPELPEGLSDREEEVSEPLLAIADLAGGDWPRRARRAALILAGAKDEDDDTVGVRLLAAVRALFAERDDPPWIETADVVSWLNARDDANWSTWNDRFGIKIHDVAHLLRRYDAGPRQRRPGGGRDPVRGLWLDVIEDAWSRYVGDPRNAGTGGTAVPGEAAGHAVTGEAAGQEPSVPGVPRVPPFLESQDDVSPWGDDHG
jgi:Protein of unknown function (DUF3631)